MKRILAIMVLTAAVSCQTFEADEILLPKEDISFTLKGVEQFTYSPLTCQLAHNSTNNEYRVFDDRISNYFIVRCQERPVNEGQELRADVVWTTSRNTRSLKDLTFRVKKTDGTGKIWMWCEQKSIGIVIKNL